MNLRNPIQSVAVAVHNAVESHLLGVPSEAPRGVNGQPATRRPAAHECDVVMFHQCWRREELGYKNVSRDAHIEGDTVVVVGPMNDACVYFAGSLAYSVRQPNRRFFMDVAARWMADVASSHRYEGRDDAEIESVEYCLEVELSRLQAEVAAGADKERAALIASLLCSYTHRFQQISGAMLAPSPAFIQGAWAPARRCLKAVHASTDAVRNVSQRDAISR